MPAIETTSETIPKPRQRRRAAASRDAFAFTMKDAQSLGAPGRTSLYKLAAAGKLKMLKVAGRTMIDGDSLRALLGRAA